VRIATITNWAYGITVGLTLASGSAMLMASSADRVERQAVQQRQVFDTLSDEVENDAWALSDLARLYVVKPSPETLTQYQQLQQTDKSIEQRLAGLKDNGASREELALLQDGLRIADELQDEQQAALTHVARGDAPAAIAVLYGKAYETELERMQTQIDRFRQMLEHRAAIAIDQATERSRIWRTLSEIMVGLTALMFLFVLGFILKRRVLYPVVRLSDVVQRLASQDYAVETPHFTQVDEIGDMAQAIRIFRENGLARQQLEQQRDADWAIRELLAQWLSPAGETTSFAPDDCWAIRRGLSHPPVQGEPDITCYHLPEAHDGQSLCVPLIAQGEAIGLLSFQNVTASDAPSRAYLELMAEALGLALANQRLRSALLEKALFDSLTGLRNRHHLDEALHSQMALAVHTHTPLSCLMIDIDHFKAINDRYGHEAGDLVIKSVATIVQRAVRDIGMAFRYGGEEFLVLLPGIDEAGAHQCARA